MYPLLKKLGLASAILSLVLIVSLLVGAEGADDPWKFLKDFAQVPGAASRVEERYVAAMFHNSKKALRAIVIYPADCGSQSCSLSYPVAYSAFDAKGLIVKLYVEPGAEFIVYRIFASALTGLDAA